MSAAPVSQLKAMLAGMNPKLCEAPYRFVAHGPDEDFIDLLHRTFAMVREDEGMTLVIRARRDDPGPFFARVTLQVHSDLEAVGLTAGVSAALADVGLACNVIAGFHHDHLFVPWEDRAQALEALERLSLDAGR
ncbi:MAG: ACT domain-containing protein [Erythrobacter sp.]|uniref:ACT domain-containing protein n=1 Tax=Erythrobacter sp. TaxID=1042 RepID=UPI002619AD88|nr:ACT domain-containing protein [Erythrobacter sp.]MDJ0978980.1 ACT domain-containing protein [Erythrobacter sp.]